MPAVLTGSSQPVPLGEGCAFVRRAFRGARTCGVPRSAGGAFPPRTAEDGTAALEEALNATNVTEVREVELSVRSTAPAPRPASEHRCEALPAAMPSNCRCPMPATNTANWCSRDEAGVMTWHPPIEGPAARPARPERRAAPARVKRFVIPATPVEPPPAEAGASRSLLSAVGRKLLKVLVYPVTDPIVGAIGTLFAEHWEGRNRPHAGCGISRPRISTSSAARRSTRPAGQPWALAPPCSSSMARSAPRMAGSATRPRGLRGALSPLRRTRLRVQPFHDGARPEGERRVAARAIRRRSV